MGGSDPSAAGGQTVTIAVALLAGRSAAVPVAIAEPGKRRSLRGAAAQRRGRVSRRRRLRPGAGTVSETFSVLV